MFGSKADCRGRVHSVCIAPTWNWLVSNLLITALVVLKCHFDAIKDEGLEASRGFDLCARGFCDGGFAWHLLGRRYVGHNTR